VKIIYITGKDAEIRQMVNIEKAVEQEEGRAIWWKIFFYKIG